MKEKNTDKAKQKKELFKQIFCTIAKMGHKRGKRKKEKKIDNNSNNSNNDNNDNICNKLFWKVDASTTYYEQNVFFCNVKNYYTIIDKKRFKKMDVTLLKKFITAMKNGKNVKLIYENKVKKVLKLAELTIKKSDFRMITRTRFKTKVGPHNMYLLVFDECENHVQIKTIREHPNAMQTIDV